MKQPLVLDTPIGKLEYHHRIGDQLVYRGDIAPGDFPIEAHIDQTFTGVAVYSRSPQAVEEPVLIEARKALLRFLDEMRADLLPKKLPLEPLDDKVLLRPIKEAEQTDGGIYLPDDAREGTFRAEVLAVGPGRLLPDGKRTPLAVQEGDEVIYAKFAGTRLTFDNEEIVLVPERDIMCRIRKGLDA